MPRLPAALLAAILSCGLLAPLPAHAADKTVIVALVASAAQKPMSEIVTLYEKSHPGVTVQTVFGGAQVLRVQVESGSGDMIAVGSTTIVALEGKLTGAVPIFKYHEVVETTSASTKIHSLKDLATKGVRLVLGTADSPHGRYSRAVLDKASKSYGASFGAEVLTNVVSTKTSAAAIPAAILAGVADGGIGFSSDEAPGLKLIPIPAEFDVVTTTQAAVVKSSQHASAAADFVTYLAGSEAQAIFHKHHFD